MFTTPKLSLFLALKTIMRGDKGSFFLTIIIMLVVFLNLLFIDSIFAGVSETMDNSKIDYQYGEVIIEPATGEHYIKDTDTIIDALRDYDYIKSIAVHLRTGATLINDKFNDGRDVVTFNAGIIGIDPETESDSIDIASNILEGRYLRKDDVGKAILGADLAGSYGSSVFPEDLDGVHTGDTIRALYSNGISREYEVVGIYKTKNFDTDSKMLVTHDELQSVLDTTHESSEIILRLTQRELSQKAIADIRVLAVEDYKLSDWNDKIAFGRSINKSFDVVSSMLRFIGAFVAGLVIFIIIFVDIVNRRRQIGILKAIGIPERVITYSYVIRGMFYTISGMILGYTAMRFGIIEFFRAHPINFPMGDMLPFIETESLRMSIILFTIAGLIGSLFPTLKEVRRHILTLMK